MTPVFFSGADPSIRDYSGHKPIYYVKSMSLPLQSKLPAWRRHYYASPCPQITSNQPNTMLRDRNSVRSSNRNSFLGPAQNKNHKGEHDKHHHFYDRKGSVENNENFHETSKSKKISRKESMLKGISMRRKNVRSKHYDTSEMPPIDPTPPSPAPNPPMAYGNFKPPSGNSPMWKPVGPKS